MLNSASSLGAHEAPHPYFNCLGVSFNKERIKKVIYAIAIAAILGVAAMIILAIPSIHTISWQVALGSSVGIAVAAILLINYAAGKALLLHERELNAQAVKSPFVFDTDVRTEGIEAIGREAKANFNRIKLMNFQGNCYVLEDFKEEFQNLGAIVQRVMRPLFEIDINNPNSVMRVFENNFPGLFNNEEANNICTIISNAKARSQKNEEIQQLVGLAVSTMIDTNAGALFDVIYTRLPSSIQWLRSPRGTPLFA